MLFFNRSALLKYILWAPQSVHMLDVTLPFGLKYSYSIEPSMGKRLLPSLLNITLLKFKKKVLIVYQEGHVNRNIQLFDLIITFVTTGYKICVKNNLLYLINSLVEIDLVYIPKKQRITFWCPLQRGHNCPFCFTARTKGINPSALP
jgi:hypothetical protein